MVVGTTQTQACLPLPHRLLIDCILAAAAAECAQCANTFCPLCCDTQLTRLQIHFGTVFFLLLIISLSL